MLLIAETFQFQQWDYRMFMWLGSMLLVFLILFMAAVAVFVGRSRSEKRS